MKSDSHFKEEGCPRSVRAKHRAKTTFEQGTGYDPEQLARHVVLELRYMLRQPRFDHAMDILIELVSARAERVWAAHPYWRKRWSRCRASGDARPLLIFFRHWALAAAVREGFCQKELCIATEGLINKVKMVHESKTK